MGLAELDLAASRIPLTAASRSVIMKIHSRFRFTLMPASLALYWEPPMEYTSYPNFVLVDSQTKSRHSRAAMIIMV